MLLLEKASSVVAVLKTAVLATDWCLAQSLDVRNWEKVCHTLSLASECFREIEVKIGDAELYTAVRFFKSGLH